ncbi:MAG: hypothetical protein PWQ24_476 [Mesotoga sp.]|jgi:alcohol dehydrogenase|nr:hypothetical protein [Mesotoga sp.]
MWKYFLPTRVFAGRQVISQNGELLKEFGTKAFIVTGKSSAKKSGALDEVLRMLEALDIPSSIFDEVEENPSFFTVEKGGRLLSENECDFVIAIGGGSPLDAGKAISAVGMNGCSCEDLYKGKNLPSHPIVAIPTTSGTGSEVTQYSVLTNADGQKKGFGMPSIFPAISFLDPRYTVTMPLDVTIATALDALSHSLEGEVVNKGQNPLLKTLSREANRLIKDSLDRILLDEDDIDSRERMQFAATLAGIVIAHTGTTAVHAAGYPLSSFKNVKHGMANALILVEIFKKIAEADKDRISAAIDPFESLDELQIFIQRFISGRIFLRISDEEINEWSDYTSKASHLKKTPGDFDKEFFMDLYRRINNI